MYYSEFSNADIIYQSKLYWLTVMPYDGIVLEFVFFGCIFGFFFAIFLMFHIYFLWQSNGGFCRQQKTEIHELRDMIDYTELKVKYSFRYLFENFPMN
jgi:hypothetical protein